MPDLLTLGAWPPGEEHTMTDGLLAADGLLLPPSAGEKVQPTMTLEVGADHLPARLPQSRNHHRENAFHGHRVRPRAVPGGTR